MLIAINSITSVAMASVKAASANLYFHFRNAIDDLRQPKGTFYSGLDNAGLLHCPLVCRVVGGRIQVRGPESDLCLHFGDNSGVCYFQPVRCQVGHEAIMNCR